MRWFLQQHICPLWSLPVTCSVSVMTMVTVANMQYISLKGLQHRSRGILSGIWCDEACFWVLNCSLALTKSSTQSICMSMYVSVYVCERERHFSLLISTGRSGYFASMAARVPREMRWGEPPLSESKLRPSLGQPLSITQHNNWASSNCLLQELDVTYS